MVDEQKLKRVCDTDLRFFLRWWEEVSMKNELTPLEKFKQVDSQAER